MTNTFKYNKKIHSTIKVKSFFKLYAEHMHFLATRASSLVTKSYTDYTFEQSPFKKNL